MCASGWSSSLANHLFYLLFLKLFIVGSYSVIYSSDIRLGLPFFSSLSFSSYIFVFSLHSLFVFTFGLFEHFFFSYFCLYFSLLLRFSPFCISSIIHLLSFQSYSLLALLNLSLRVAMRSIRQALSRVGIQVSAPHPPPPRVFRFAGTPTFSFLGGGGGGCNVIRSLKETLEMASWEGRRGCWVRAKCC